MIATRSYIRWCQGAVLILMLIALVVPVRAQNAPPPAAAVPLIGLRYGSHPGFSRLVLAWPGEVGYTVAQDDRTVTLTFDRPGRLDAAVLGRMRLRNLERIVEAQSSPLQLKLTLRAGAQVRHSREGRTLVLDLVDPGKTDPGKTKPSDPAAAAKAGGDAARPAAAASPAPATPATPAPTTPAPAPSLDAAKPGAAAAGAGNAPAGPGGAGAVPATAPTADAVLTFDPQQPSSAAVYQRSGYLYVVFDRKLTLPSGIGIIPGSYQIGQPEAVPSSSVSAFRISVPPTLVPKVTRQDTKWQVALSAPPAPPVASLPVVADPDNPFGARILVHAEDAATVVSLLDPTVGDLLYVATLPVAGQAVTERRSYAQLELLPAVQGIVVRPTADNVGVHAAADGVAISTASGLKLSPAADFAGITPPAALAPPSDTAPAPLFDLEAWRHGDAKDFSTARQMLQHTIEKATEETRPQAEAELARFYFARGYGAEAVGLMDMLAAAHPDFNTNTNFKGLRGAARVLDDMVAEGDQDLSDPDLQQYPDVKIWQGVAAAKRHEWGRAAQLLGASSARLDTYPDPLFTRVAMAAIEAATETGNQTEAQRLLNRMSARSGGSANSLPAVQYFNGVLLSQQGKISRAEEMFKAASNSSDHLYQVRGELALINLDLAQGRLKPADAAVRLERLRFAWRGDDLEFDILHRRGQVHLMAGNYPAGFAALRETEALFPDNPRSAGIAGEMTTAFRDIFIKDGAAQLNPVEALGLYDQFKELTPVGDDGDEIIRKLAERLVEIDLLDRAGDLLEHQVNFRLQGQKKGEVGTRLAAIRLLDGKGDLAVKALDESEVPELTTDQQSERRTMRAKALAMSGKTAEALQLLANDNSRPAEYLRSDIARQAGQWAESAAVLARLIGPGPAAGAPPLDLKTSQLVINRAIALSMAGDSAALGQLRKDFSTAMATGPDANTFLLLTRPDQATGLGDAQSIKNRVAEVSLFQDFLNGYRKMKDAPPPS
ncbi:MAG: tetratricopeptide repeat protein [Azospirillaceae bacterium]|nr:tetratricopeptide repeat protein [Azospirillaceae bacterium]